MPLHGAACMQLLHVAGPYKNNIAGTMLDLMTHNYPTPVEEINLPTLG